MIIKFELDTSNINYIQLETLLRTIERSKHAHFTNVHLRINGDDQYEEADWLKYITVTEAKRGLPCPVCNGEGE